MPKRNFEVWATFFKCVLFLVKRDLTWESWGLYVLPIYTISISILCVSQEVHNLFESNQQVYDFYNQGIFEKQRHYGPF